VSVFNSPLYHHHHIAKSVAQELVVRVSSPPPALPKIMTLVLSVHQSEKAQYDMTPSSILQQKSSRAIDPTSLSVLHLSRMEQRPTQRGQQRQRGRHALPVDHILIHQEAQENNKEETKRKCC
jgi:hypothetical protein